MLDIQISEKALSKLTNTAEKEGIDLDSTYLRVSVISGGCSGLSYDLGWDTALTDSDESHLFGEITVVMDLPSRLYMEGARLDFSDGLEGKGFHFVNPQAVRSCACGESFAL